MTCADAAAGPDVSVVVVGYNSAHLLPACLGSLQAAARMHSWEAIVADNGSRDDTLAMLSGRDWAHVTVLPLGENLGFARASNRALVVARGRYCLLFNPDARAEPGALDALIDFLDAHPEAAVAAPKLLNADSSDQGTARAFPTPLVVLFGRKSFLTRLFPRNRWSRQYLVGRTRQGTSTPFEVDWVSGACLMVRRAVVDQTGGLDEGFFMYWEDADWCRRIRTAGHAIYCVPRAVVTHLEGQSSQRRRARLVWTFHRSAYRYYVKHHARQAWHPLRAVAAAGLTVRAVLLIGLGQLNGSASPESPHAATVLHRSR